MVERNGAKFGPLGLVFSVYRVVLTVICSSSVWGYSMRFQFLTTLYLGNGYSWSKMNQNLGLWGEYLVYVN